MSWSEDSNEQSEAVIVCFENDEFSGPISRNFLVEAAFLLAEKARKRNANSRQNSYWAVELKLADICLVVFIHANPSTPGTGIAFC